MKGRADRLHVVVDMAKQTEDESAARLDKKRQALNDEQQRFGDLKEYYAEYDVSFKKASNVMRAEDFAAKRNFLHQLALSCELQGSQVELMQQEFDAAINEWRLCHLKYERLQGYVAQLEKEELARIDKQEQKSVDEWVSQVYFRK